MFKSYSTLKSPVVQYSSWHTGAGTEWTGERSHWLAEGEEVEDSRAEASSEIGDGGQAAMSLMPDVNGAGSGSLLEPDAHLHLWTFCSLKVCIRGLTIYILGGRNETVFVHSIKSKTMDRTLGNSDYTRL